MADETIFVKSALPPAPGGGGDGGVPTAFWERDPAHPEDSPDGPHEVYVHGDAVREVGRTGAVLGALKDERLVEVSKKEAARAEAAAPAAAEEPKK